MYVVANGDQTENVGLWLAEALPQTFSVSASERICLHLRSVKVYLRIYSYLLDYTFGQQFFRC